METNTLICFAGAGKKNQQQKKLDLKRATIKGDTCLSSCWKWSVESTGWPSAPSDNYIQPINAHQPTGWAHGVEALCEHVLPTLTQTHEKKKKKGQLPLFKYFVSVIQKAQPLAFVLFFFCSSVVKSLTIQFPFCPHTPSDP